MCNCSEGRVCRSSTFGLFLYYYLGHRGSIPSAKNKLYSPVDNIQLQIPTHLTKNCLNPRAQQVLNPGLTSRILQISRETSLEKEISDSGNGKCILSPFLEDSPGATTLEQRAEDRRKTSNFCLISRGEENIKHSPKL